MDQNTKQQAVEQIKRANNILVTVSTNPSVDQLSAALGLTLMLNKMGKHTTAVVSGELPPAISFLDPTKTFTNSVDGLRDFIIALDKEKADHLRYKVENDVVRIFITPYHGEITEKDLQFSQGDFNVEVIVALGVTNKDDIDTAIKAHGRILHDASVVTINTGTQKGSLGAIDWQDPAASSLSEMMVSVSEAFQGGLLDAQISTALLTGIDAATDRFSNAKTSPKIMTMAAQLMAAGANQQLIATNLTPEAVANASAQQVETNKAESSELKLNHDGGDDNGGLPPLDQRDPIPPPANIPVDPLPEPNMPPEPEPVTPAPTPAPVPPPLPGAAPMPDFNAPDPAPGVPVAAPVFEPPQPVDPSPPPLTPQEPELPPIIPDHPPAGIDTSQPPAPSGPAPQEPGKKSLADIENEISALASPSDNTDAPEQEPVAQIQKKTQHRLPEPDPAPTMADIEEDGRHPEGSIVGEQKSDPPIIGKAKSQAPMDQTDKPVLGGTFNATSDDAHDKNQEDREAEKNGAILEHGNKAQEEEAADTTMAPDTQPEPTVIQPESSTESSSPAPSDDSINVDEARAAVEAAMGSASFDPSNNPLQSNAAAPLGGDLHPGDVTAPPTPIAEPALAPLAPEPTVDHLNAPPVVTDSGDMTLPSEINIDESGNIMPAAPAPAGDPAGGETLAIPGAGAPATTEPAPAGGLPLAGDSLDAPPPLPNPPGPPPTS